LPTPPASDAAPPAAPGAATPAQVASNLSPLDNILATLRNSDSNSRRSALFQLQSQQVPDDRRAEVEKAVAALLDDSSLRMETLRVLDKYATRASEPALLKMLPGTDPGASDSFVCQGAIDLLGKIQDPACAPTVAKYLEFFFTRSAASQCLQSLGSPAELAVTPYLAGGVKKDEQLSIEAAHILEKIGTSKSQAALIDARSRVRGQFAKAAIQGALDHLAQRGSSPARGR
jgi:hypothetical protein